MIDTLRSTHDGTPASGEPGRGALVFVYSPDASIVGTERPLSELHGQPLGREVEGGILISDSRPSTLHLRLMVSAGGVSFADAGSSNGTFLNGAQEARGMLRPWDVLRVGDTFLVVRAGPSIDDIRQRAERAGPSPLPVLILGETGTGK